MRINDDQHQYGNIGAAITGDPRVYGRVYVGTTRVARFSLYATRTLRQQILVARPFTAVSSSVRIISRSSGKTIVIDGLFVSIT